MNNEFGFWFSGLVDGEGSFNLNLNNRRRFVPQPRFDLVLRADDVDVLKLIQSTLGIGNVFMRSYEYKNSQGYKSNPGASFTIWSKDDCIALVSVLDAYPLRSKKTRDYAIWSEAVRLWASQSRKGRWSLANPEVMKKAERMRELYTLLKETRKFPTS